MSRPANPVTLPLADYSPKHFLLAVMDGVATVTLNRPEVHNCIDVEMSNDLIAVLVYDAPELSRTRRSRRRGR